MNRNQEYWQLIGALGEAPPELDGTVDRAKARARRARAGRWLGIPVASLGGVAAAFVLLVNCSLPFARACGNVPFLRELASAVAFSPSLKAAVEHDFVQPVGASQTLDGITMTVEYLIVDDRQLNIFFTLESDEYPELGGFPELTRPDGTYLADMGLSYGRPEDGDDLRQITAHFMDSDVPLDLRFTFRAYGVYSLRYEPDRADPGMTEFAFDLSIDPRFVHTGQTIPLDRELTLDGQHITAESVEIYPTHLRLNLADDPANTAWLRDIEFYLEDEKGTRYDPISNGITATGDPGGTPFYPSHRLESSYFGDAQHLTLHITGVTWLDKDARYAEVDLENQTATGLPQGVSLSGILRRGDTAELDFQHDSPRQTFSWDYLDPQGGKHHWESMSSSTRDQDGDGVCEFREDHVTLEDYPWSTVRLGLNYSRSLELPEPVSLTIK